SRSDPLAPGGGEGQGEGRLGRRRRAIVVADAAAPSVAGGGGAPMRNRPFVSALVSLIVVLAAVYPAGAADEVRIGIVSPMTGPNAKFGQAQKNAVTMAAEDVNNAGGVRSMGGARIKLVFGDTRGEADTGVTETDRL